jgi:anti-sigma regulatory factor (Ser/Thr protein kinase)
VHGALFYAGRRQFLDGTVPFIREGLAAGEPAMVVVGATKIAALREALGDDANRVQFADMTEIGRNPARIIPRWREFVDEHLRTDRPVRGIGEPISAGRHAAELVECQAHETLLNLAFADSPPWSMLCPYDVEALPPAVVDEARRSHPFVTHNGTRQASRDYVDAHSSPPHLNQPLPPPSVSADVLAFGPGREALRAVRTLVQRHAHRAGMEAVAAEHLTLATNELATNSLCHGGGMGTIRIWREGDTLICEVRDGGHIHDQPLLGRQRPTVEQIGGRGLWLANQLCDLVQIRSSPAGTTVRLRMRITPDPFAERRLLVRCGSGQ